MDFFVSVIIPAFNVEKFIENTISSVINQAVVNEVLIINDGSSDNTFKIIQKLKTQHPIIKILEHKNGTNKGRSESRNLGIKNATCNYIAFLDADDHYLENRFDNDKMVFQQNEQTEGVYNAVGFHFYRNHSKQEKDNFKLTTLTKKVTPKDLFKTLLSGKYGYFHINGLTLKRSVFEKVGYFNDKLMVAEDTDFFYKLALISNLYPGILDKPVAMRGIHDSNVFNRTDLYRVYEIKMYESLYYWSIKKNKGLKTIERFLERIWILRYKQNKGLIKNIVYWFALVINNPSIIFSYLTIKYFPVVRMRKKYFHNFKN